MARANPLTYGLVTQSMFTGWLMFLVFSNEDAVPLDIQLAASAAVGAMSLAMGVIGGAVADSLSRRWAAASIAIIVVMLAIAATAHADCGQLFRQRTYAYTYAAPVYYKQAYVQPYYVPAVQYRAGADIEAEALAEKISRRVAEKLTALNLQQQAPRTVVLSNKCAGCHNAADAKGGLVLDGSTSVDDYYFRRIVEIVGGGVDVPPPMQRVIASLQPAEKGAILDEIISLKPAGSLQQTGKYQPQQAPDNPAGAVKNMWNKIGPPASYGAPPPPQPEPAPLPPEDGGLR